MGTRIMKVLSVLSIAFLLVNCGGGSSSSGDSDSDGIPASFDLLSQSGTWRLTVDSSFSDDSDFTIGPDTVNLVASANVRQIEVTAFEVKGDQVVSQGCDADAAETESLTEVEESFDLTDLTDDPACANETIDYVKNSDSSYRVAYNCPGLLSFSIDFVKLNNTAEFDFGSLSFASTRNADLNTSDGVCGGLEDGLGTSVYTPQPNALSLVDGETPINTITVAAPYDGNRISLRFQFFDDIQPGTYMVKRIAAANDEASVDLSSVIYGGTPDDPESESAESGTVTIAAIGELSASGSFDIVTESGDAINGSFSFDIE